MRFVLPILALAALPACMGGGGGSGSSSSGPSASMNASMGSLLNGARSNTLLDLEYNASVGQAAQDHVDDMLANDYLNTAGTFDDGTGTGNTVMRDGADTAVQVYGVTWNDFIHMIAQGDGTVNTVFDQWSATGSEGNGDNEIAFNSALNDGNFDEFGIARAGTGGDTRWMLIILDR